MSVELVTNAIGRGGGWHWESDRAIRALTQGNAGRAKGSDFRRAVEEAAEGDIGQSLFKPHADPKVPRQLCHRVKQSRQRLRGPDDACKGSAHIGVEIQHKGGPSLGVSPERSCGSG